MCNIILRDVYVQVGYIFSKKKKSSKHKRFLGVRKVS